MKKIKIAAIPLVIVTIMSLVIGSTTASAASYAPGAGSNNPAAFISAFNLIGGQPRIGDAINAVHSWNAGCTQDFVGGWSGKGAIMQANCSGAAYSVVYRQWAYIEARWGGMATAIIGDPTGSDYRWGAGWIQHFAGGNQNNTTLARADQTGIVRSVRGDTRNFWLNSQGGPAGGLGYPVSDEYVWSGIYKQDFQGGSIIWDPVNRARLYSPAAPPPVISSREQKAVSWAIAEKNSANPRWSDEFGRSWSGYCEGFAEVAFGTRGRFPSAIAHYRWQASNGRINTGTKPPAGALVFYGGGGGYGHIGVSIGNDQVISTQGYGGQNLPVWQHSTTYIGQYLGWAYAPPSWPGR